MRARLRRADSIEDILLTDAFLYFLTYMQDIAEWSDKTPQRLLTLACIAGVLSHVKEDKLSPSRIDYTKKTADTPAKMASFAEQIATPLADKSKAPLSELRFQQLQKSPTLDDFYVRLIRAVHILNDQVNIVSLAEDIIDWHKEFNHIKNFRNPQNRLAVRWASDYYTVLAKNPN
jgi:CRISPR system Cascade subunit CasB